MDLDIIATTDNYRVRLELDTDPAEPNDIDGMVPVLRVGGGYSTDGPAEAFNRQANGFEDAFNRFGDIARSNAHQREIFARYARIFLGTLKVEEWNVGISNEYGYIGFDTAEWRDSMGIVDTSRLMDEDYLSEVSAWVTGDVYGFIIERTDREDPEEDYDWEEVEACWGLVGRDYAEQTAREELDATDKVSPAITTPDEITWPVTDDERGMYQDWQSEVANGDTLKGYAQYVRDNT